MEYPADTLDKISDERDDLGDHAPEERRKTFDPSSVIDVKKAADKARQRKDGTITKWNIEGKDTGRIQYEFDIRPAGASADAENAEIQTDAKDGSVIKDS